MRQFIIRVLILIILVVLLCNVGKFFISPYYGDYYFLSKYKYLQADTSYNMIFMGSSRTYRNIVPMVIDSINQELKFKSYNLATAGTFNPETYYQYEQFLGQKNEHIKYAIVEIQPLYHPSDINLSNQKSYYWMTWRYLIYTIKYILTSNYELLQKSDLLILYSKLFVHRIFDFSKYKTLVKEILNVNTINNKELTKYQGFYSLDEFSNDSNRPDIIDRRTDFLADTSILYERIKPNIKSFNISSHDDYLNYTHLTKLRELIQLSNEKGIKLIFLIQPKQIDYNELLAIKERIPSENLIEMASYQLYPEFYHAKFSFDIAHLNIKGAFEFSRLLSDKIKNRVL